VPLLLLIAGVACSAAPALRWNAGVQERARADFDDAMKESAQAIDGESGRERGRAGATFTVALPRAEIAQVSAPARVVDC
jgi:hypothetical protein